jgi:hypothetical protein
MDIYATGQRSVSKKNLLPTMFNDARVASVFGYRNRLQTCLKMFMLPWERQAGARPTAHKHKLEPDTQRPRHTTGGTRTIRPSTSNPNFLNISKSWHDKDDGYEHPSSLLVLSGACLLFVSMFYRMMGVSFVIATTTAKNYVYWGTSKTPRLCALTKKTREWTYTITLRQLIEDIAGLKYHRTQVKITNFRRIYGGGAPATAGALHVSIDVAKQLLKAHGEALPGVKDLSPNYRTG